MTQDGSARLHPLQGPVVRLRRREGPLSEYAVIQTQFRDAAVRRLRQGLGGRWAEGLSGPTPACRRARQEAVTLRLEEGQIAAAKRVADRMSLP